MTRPRGRLLLFCGLLYALAYGSARGGHWLVHQTGYHTVAGQGQVLEGHRISQGDFGAPALAPMLSAAQSAAVLLFWPAAVLELGYWYVVAPRGTPLPYAQTRVLATEKSEDKGRK